WWGVGGLTFSPGGDVLVQGIEDLLVWDLNTGLPSKIAQKDGRVFQIRFSPDGRRLIAVKHHGNLAQHRKDTFEKRVLPAIREMIPEPGSVVDNRNKATQDQKPPAKQVLTWTFPGWEPAKPVPTLCEDEVLSPDGQLIGGKFLRGRWLL